VRVRRETPKKRRQSALRPKVKPRLLRRLSPRLPVVRICPLVLLLRLLPKQLRFSLRLLKPHLLSPRPFSLLRRLCNRHRLPLNRLRRQAAPRRLGAPRRRSDPALAWLNAVMRCNTRMSADLHEKAGFIPAFLVSGQPYRCHPSPALPLAGVRIMISR